jgi:hypothetical protein
VRNRQPSPRQGYGRGRSSPLRSAQWPAWPPIRTEAKSSRAQSFAEARSSRAPSTSVRSFRSRASCPTLRSFLRARHARMRITNDIAASLRKMRARELCHKRRASYTSQRKRERVEQTMPTTSPRGREGSRRAARRLRPDSSSPICGERFLRVGSPYEDARSNRTRTRWSRQRLAFVQRSHSRRRCRPSCRSLVTSRNRQRGIGTGDTTQAPRVVPCDPRAVDPVTVTCQECSVDAGQPIGGGLVLAWGR